MDETLHIIIKKEYAAALIEDLIRLDAVESVKEPIINLTSLQMAALDQEIENIQTNPSYLKKWNDVRGQFKKT